MKGNGGGGKSAEQTIKESFGICLALFEAKHVFVGLEWGDSDAKDQNEPEEENDEMDGALEEICASGGKGQDRDSKYHAQEDGFLGTKAEFDFVFCKNTNG